METNAAELQRNEQVAAASGRTRTPAAFLSGLELAALGGGGRSVTCGGAGQVLLDPKLTETAHHVPKHHQSEEPGWI